MSRRGKNEEKKQGTKRTREQEEIEEEGTNVQLLPENIEHIMLQQEDPKILEYMCIMSSAYTNKCNDKSFQLKYLEIHFPESYDFLSKQWNNYENMSRSIFGKSLMPVFMTINQIGPIELKKMFDEIEFIRKKLLNHNLGDNLNLILDYPLIEIEKPPNDDIQIIIIFKKTVIEKMKVFFDLITHAKKTKTSMKGADNLVYPNTIRQYIENLTTNDDYDDDEFVFISNVEKDKRDKYNIQIKLKLLYFEPNKDDENYQNWVNKLFDFFTFLALLYRIKDPQYQHKFSTDWWGWGGEPKRKKSIPMKSIKIKSNCKKSIKMKSNIRKSNRKKSIKIKSNRMKSNRRKSNSKKKSLIKNKNRKNAKGRFF